MIVIFFFWKTTLSPELRFEGQNSGLTGVLTAHFILFMTKHQTKTIWTFDVWQLNVSAIKCTVAAPEIFQPDVVVSSRVGVAIWTFWRIPEHSVISVFLRLANLDGHTNQTNTSSVLVSDNWRRWGSCRSNAIIMDTHSGHKLCRKHLNAYAHISVIFLSLYNLIHSLAVKKIVIYWYK